MDTSDPTPTHEPVVCLHASASSGRQWRSLVQQAGGGWQWHMPDLYGHGGRPAWPELMPSDLAVEAQGVLSHLVMPPQQGFHLVAHSYGAAVALQIAIQHPERVRSLTLYEPAAFGVLTALGPADPAWEEITDVAADLTLHLREGQAAEAARGFCAYWHGRDIWPELSTEQRHRLADTMPTVRRQFRALFAGRWSDAELDRVRVPVQLFCGRNTRDSARRVAQCLAVRLPRVRLTTVADAHHMSPLTDPIRINGHLLAALSRMRATCVA